MSSRLNPESGLEIETRREGDATIVAARGEVTVFSSPALRESLRKIAGDRPARLILDLTQTRYIDSSGVATLVEALQTLQRYNGKLVLAGMNQRVRGVFEIARLDGIFPMAPTVQEALKA
jgi:anti-sigma B factor antagonist